MDSILREDLIRLFSAGKIGFGSLSKGNSLLDDKEFVIEVFKKTDYYISIKNLSDNLKSDPEVMKIAVEKDFYNFNFAMGKVKADEEIALIALKAEGECSNITTILSNCDPKLLDSRAFLAKALEFSPSSYSDIPKLFQNDAGLAKITVKSYYGMYDYIPKELQGNPEVVEGLLSGNGNSLQKVPYEFKDNPKMVLIALKSADNLSREHIAEEYGTDREGLKEKIFEHASDRLKDMVGKNDIETTLEKLSIVEDLKGSNKEATRQVSAQKLK